MGELTNADWHWKADSFVAGTDTTWDEEGASGFDFTPHANAVWLPKAPSGDKYVYMPDLATGRKFTVTAAAMQVTHPDIRIRVHWPTLKGFSTGVAGTSAGSTVSGWYLNLTNPVLDDRFSFTLYSYVNSTTARGGQRSNLVQTITTDADGWVWLRFHCNDAQNRVDVYQSTDGTTWGTAFDTGLAWSGNASNGTTDGLFGNAIVGSDNLAMSEFILYQDGDGSATFHWRAQDHDDLLTAETSYVGGDTVTPVGGWARGYHPVLMTDEVSAWAGDGYMHHTMADSPEILTTESLTYVVAIKEFDLSTSNDTNICEFLRHVDDGGPSQYVYIASKHDNATDVWGRAATDAMLGTGLDFEVWRLYAITRDGNTEANLWEVTEAGATALLTDSSLTTRTNDLGGTGNTLELGDDGTYRTRNILAGAAIWKSELTQSDLAGLYADFFGAGSATIIPAEAAHAHSADNVTLVQQHTLATAESTHAHAADNVTVAEDATDVDIVSADATHAHAADGVTLDIPIVTQDATHAHTSSGAGPALTFNETFEVTGYVETWSEGETLGSGVTLDEDFSTAGITGAPANWGDKCLKLGTVGGEDSYVLHRGWGGATDGLPISYTRLDVIIGSESLGNSEGIHFLSTRDSENEKFYQYILYQSGGGDLKLEAQIWYDGGSSNFESFLVDLDTLYRLEMKWDITNEVWEWRANGETVASGAISGEGLNRPLDGVFLGDIGGQIDAASTIYLDNFAVSTVDWIGSGSDIIEEDESAVITPADATHAHGADGTTLVQQHTLATADATHAHAADNATLAQSGDLDVADATHGHTADNVELVQQHTLATAEAAHAQTADGSTLLQVHDLTVAESTHAHAVDNTTIAEGANIAAADAAHAHSADGTTLAQQHTLATGESAHAHSADNVEIVQAGSLEVAGSTHAHSADNVATVQHFTLEVAGSTHAHAADGTTVAPSLLPADSVHAVTDDAPTFTQLHILATSDATHAFLGAVAGIYKSRNDPPAESIVSACKDNIVRAYGD